MPRKKRNNRGQDSDDEEVPSIITAEDLANAETDLVAPANKKKEKKAVKKIPNKAKPVKEDNGKFVIHFWRLIFVIRTG